MRDSSFRGHATTASNVHGDPQDADDVRSNGAAAPVGIHRGGGRGSFLFVEVFAVAVVAAVCTLLLAGHGEVMAVPVVAALLLMLDTAALPAYDRSKSLRPVVRLFTRGSVFLLFVTAAGLVTRQELRLALMALALVAAVPLVRRGAGRIWRRPQSTLLVGDRIAVSHLIAQWGSLPEVRIVGVCLSEPEDYEGDQPSEVLGYPVVGDLDSAADIARTRHVAQVVVAPGPVLTAYDVRRLSWALEDSETELAVAAEVHGAVPRRIEPRLMGRRLVLSVSPTRRPMMSSLLKSLLDRAAGLLLLVLTSPLLAVLVALVRLESPGGGFFRQIRAGQFGRPFYMLKLRTMVADAEQRRGELEELNEGAGPLFKLTHDPRVTKVGRILRRTSLDELPQLWNVVRGEMSLIGPRPALPHETDEYDDWIRRRLSVKPGMTGLWQVSGRSRLSWNETVRLDLDYVDNWTLAGDMSIVGRTVNAVLRRDGAV